MKEILRALYFVLRLPVILAFRMAFPVRHKQGGQVVNILVIRMDRLGDLVTSFPFFENLRKAYPQARITCLTSPYLADLVNLLDPVDRTIVYGGFFKTARLLRNERFDMVFDPVWDYTLKTALLAYLSASPVRIGFAWGFRELLFSDGVTAESQKNKQIVELTLSLLERAGIPTPVRVPVFQLQTAYPAAAGTVCIHPGGTYPSQRWSKENFALLIQRLLERTDKKIVIAAGSQDRQTAAYLASQGKSPRVSVVYPGLGALPGVFASSALVVCNNSGPLHLAAALGVPTVSVMGPTDPVRWWPAGEGHIVLRTGISCSPCSRAVCKRHACLENITVEEVVEAVLGVLEERKG